MFELLAQQSPPPPVVDPDIYGDPEMYYEPSLFELLFFGLGIPAFWLVAFAFQIWMAVECLRKDPDRYLWVWIIVLVPFGSAVYFFLRWFPNNNIRLPSFMRKWTRGREIDRLRTATVQIGNPHQHIQLGDVLQEINQQSEAGDAYAEALEKEPDNLQALWGAARVDLHFKEYDNARQRCKKVLDIDPQYKFGDVSFAYGDALAKLDKTDAAIEHLEQHVRRWPNPEALYTLAFIHADEGNHQQAREHLHAMLQGINRSPRGVARKYALSKGKAKRLLRRLNATAARD
jgi:hypothetical protein